MKSNILISRILTLLMSFMIVASIFAMSTKIAYAGVDDVQAAVQQYGVSNFSGYITDDPSVGASSGYQAFSITDGSVSKTYYYDTSNETSILNHAKSLKGSAQIADLDNLYDLSADTTGAASLMSGIEGPLKTFLGILVTLITVGMTIFTAFDLCYIAFPVFRGKMDEAKANGTPGATHTNSKGETKLTIVTEDAQFAVVSAETAQTGQNAFMIYFKKRIVSFVVLAVLIFILLTGNINLITNIGIKLASGILEAINNSF
jgi:hypothetical protein